MGSCISGLCLWGLLEAWVGGDLLVQGVRVGVGTGVPPAGTSPIFMFQLRVRGTAEVVGILAGPWAGWLMGVQAPPRGVWTSALR